MIYIPNAVKKIIGSQKRKKIIESKNTTSSKSVKKIPKLNYKKISILLFVVLSIVGISILFIQSYLQIQFQKYPEDVAYLFENHQNPYIDKVQKNILVFGFDSSDGYFYVAPPTIFLTNYRTASTSSITIDSRVVLPNQIRIRDYFNVPTTENPPSITEFIFEIEKVVGVRIDRYIAIDINQFPEFAKPINIAFTGLGEDVSINNSLDFLVFAVNDIGLPEITNTYLGNVTDAYQKLFLQFSGITNSTKAFFFFEEVFEGIYSNIERSEFIYMLQNSDSHRNLGSRALINSFHGYIDREVNPVSIFLENIRVKDSIKSAIRQPLVLAERAELEVYNSTTIPGFATQVKNELENIGITITRFGNYSESLDINTLYILDDNPQDYAQTINVIRRTLDNNLVISTEDYTRNYTGNMVLVLGTN